jgi:hypothetical protein
MPKVHQQEAIDEAIKRYKQYKTKGVVLLGGTGSGKTMCGSLTCKEIATDIGAAQREVDPEAVGGVAVIMVVPPMGDTVPNQFKRELNDLSMGGVVLYYHGPERHQRLARWREDVKAAPVGQPCFLITSTQLLHADVRKLKETNPSLSIEAARGKMAENIGVFSIMLIDEFQDYRNGGAPTDENKDIDSSKAFYGALDAVHKHSYHKHELRFVIGLSATPCVNGSGDFYAFLRFVWDGPKYTIMNSTRRSNDKAVAKEWEDTCRHLCSRYIVKIATLEVPDTTRCAIEHYMNSRECELSRKHMLEMAKMADIYLKKLTAYRNCSVAIQRDRMFVEVEAARLHYHAAFTRCRRGMMHEYFYRPTERADPSVRPQKDAKGNIILRHNEVTGKKEPIGVPMRIDAKAVADAYPAGTKFESVLRHLEDIVDERVLIQSAYSSTCDLLAEYIRRRFPGRQVFLYHGDVPRRAAELEQFQVGDPNAIMLATRGACEKAVDIHATTMRREHDPALGYTRQVRRSVRQIFCDVALSDAEKQQAEGRTKRTLAQGWSSDVDRVREWICEESVACNNDGFPTIESFMRDVILLKKARCKHLFTMTRTEDDDHESGIETATSGTSQSAANDDKGVLMKLHDLMKPYMSNNKTAHARRGVNGTPAKRVRC